MASLVCPVDIQGTVIDPAASIGVALSYDDTAHADQLLRNADLAMYSAKAAGKGTYRLFSAAMHARAVGMLQRESDLA